jgi:lysozyme family protein
MGLAFFMLRVSAACFVVSAFCRAAATYACAGRLEAADRIGFSGFGVGALIIAAPWLWSGTTRLLKRGHDA